LITLASGITSLATPYQSQAQVQKAALSAQLVSVYAQKTLIPPNAQPKAATLPVIDNVDPNTNGAPPAPAPAPAPAPIPAPVVAPVAAVTTSSDSGSSTDIGRQMLDARFGDQYWNSLYSLWMRESGWNPNSRNSYSGACGIPQANPCSKITDMSVQGQIQWGLNYIAARYGNPDAAWSFWLSHRYY
jgi:hypothetical protein